MSPERERTATLKTHGAKRESGWEGGGGGGSGDRRKGGGGLNSDPVRETKAKEKTLRTRLSLCVQCELGCPYVCSVQVL